MASKEAMPGIGTLYEYACSSESSLGQVAGEVGIRCIRLSLADIDLANEDHVSQLVRQVGQQKGSDVWVSIPCTYHSQWQSMNIPRGGAKYEKKLRKEQRRVERMLFLAIPVLQAAFDNHGRIAIEWPRNASLWDNPNWKTFEEQNG